MAASKPDGTALDSCPAAWLEPVAPDECLELDAEVGEVAVWGVVPAALEIGVQHREPGRVHVHRRSNALAEKDIDESFSIVTVRHGDETIVIEGVAAVAYSISELSGRDMTALVCPHCGETHIDELKFATYPHAKHLCNSCGRNFFDQTPSISNPLADAHKQLGLPQPPMPEPANRPLDISSHDYSGIALWPSNAAIVSTMSRPEEQGIHVHAWDLSGRMVIDDTFAPVALDGQLINVMQLRVLAVQRALADGAPITSKNCAQCGSPLLSPQSGWLEPVTKHRCGRCGANSATRRRTFLNPLVELFSDK